jgi:hypothetical protein
MLNVTALRHNRVLQIPALGLTLFLMWLAPVLVHLLPNNNPMTEGATWLPLFYAPVVAVWFFHPGVALLAGLLMPFINHGLTGMPPLNIAILLCVELVVFSLLLAWSKSRWPRLPVAAPVTAIIAKVASALVLIAIPLVPAAPWDFFIQSVSVAWPGLLVLLAINLILLRVSPDERETQS